MRIGIIGLGLVGTALAARLLEHGDEVLGYDIRSDIQIPKSLEWVADPALLIPAVDVIVLCVLDDDALLSATRSLGLPALAATAQMPRKLLLSCVTASQSATREVAQLASAANMDFADMPLLGSSQQIASGTAIGLLGSSEAVRLQWHGLLQAITKDVRHVGPVGQGVAAKLACNLMLGLHRSALAEGMALAQGLGIKPTDFLALLQNSPAYSRAVDVAGPRMAQRDFTAVSRIAQHRKDVALILQAADTIGMDAKLAKAQAALLDSVIAQGGAQLDNVAVINAYSVNDNNQGDKNV